jgi:CHRD domain
MKLLASLALAAIVLALAGVAGAGDGGRPLATVLTGAAEVPPADPDGSGNASLALNPGTGEICYSLSVSGLDPVTAAHIHLGSAGVNGPVVVPLVPPTSGSSSACTIADRELVKAILKAPENYYVNVHTTTYPAGAVRGQLSK